MDTLPHRTVEAAMVEGVGPITIHDLFAMSDDRWGFLRDRITDQRNGKDGLVARCMACTCEVYIRAPKFRGVPRPLIQHYAGSDPTCRWYQGRNIKPDDARAAQYQGQQESNFHRQMCELIGELAALDERYVKHLISEYVPPTESKHGRFPDIYVEWKEFGTFAVEFQMSGTFQTEISARCKHYEREGIPLLWVLFGIDTAISLPQNVMDIIRRHRGNAFVLDPAAVAASREQRTLMLSCYLRDENGNLEPPKIVRFDRLAIPRSKLPFWEDRIVGPCLAEIEKKRRPWFKALSAWQSDRYKPLRGLNRQQSILVAAAFSIVATANGHETNYASDHPNISAMLNTYLSTKFLSKYVNLLSTIIENTNISHALKPTVHQHMTRYREQDQTDEQSIEWQLLRELLPEALNPLLREELTYLDALPTWAKPSR